MKSSLLILAIIIFTPSCSVDDLKNSGTYAPTAAGGSSTGGGGASAPTRTLYLFPTSTGGFGNLDGNLGGRAGADATCAAQKAANYAALACTTIWAFLSVSAADEIRDFPTTYNFSTSSTVSRPTGQAISTFAGLISGAGISLTNSVGAAAQAWTGSDNTGALHANNCNGFTGGLGTGRSGNIASTTELYISNANDNCGLTNEIYCMCY